MGDYASGLLGEGRTAQSAGDLAGAASKFLAAARFGVPSSGELLLSVLHQVKARADSGDVDMQAVFGEMALESGYDIAGAIRYLERSVLAGSALGQRVLGYALANGTGVRRNAARAAELFRASAESGDHYAEFNLSMLYHAGDGVPRDSDMSMRLLRSAAESGLPVAMAVLGDRLGELDRDREALAWYLRAADAGLHQAMHTVACWYRDGFGVNPDKIEALRWFLAMQNVGRADGIHEALELSKSMTSEQIRDGARLAGREADGEMLVQMRSG